MSKHESEDWMEELGAGNGMKVALLSHNRPNYLKQVIDSIKQQTYQDGMDIYLFQDGCINAYSWRKTANHKDIIECMKIFKDNFPSGKIYESKSNIGICENWRLAEQTMFNELNATEVLFLEDDLVLSKYYFETISNMFDEFRDDLSIGMFNAYGECKKELSTIKMKKMGHLWSYGTTKKSWEQRQDFFNEYYELVEGTDYAFRPLKEIYELYDNYGANPSVAHSQDGAKCISMMLCGQIKISPSCNLAKYIGAQGFHATPMFYNKMGFGDMPVYEEGPLTQFKIDKEYIRKVLLKEYM
jgi:hypothetical protein